MKLGCTIIFTLLLTFAFGQKLECEQLKTGEFLMKNDPEIGTGRVTRTASKQIEDYPGLGIIVELNVEWQDECTFILTLNKVLKNTSGSEVQDFKLINEIVETGDDYFLVRSHVEGVDFVTNSRFEVLE